MINHVRDLNDLPPKVVDKIFNRADGFRTSKTPEKILAGRSIITAFFESSTRTRVSFTLAAERLGASVVDAGLNQSSISKGESLLDIMHTIVNMYPDALILRHSSVGAPHFLCRELSKLQGFKTSIINAGDGAHSHPTQALIDVYTMLKNLQSLAGAKIVICGDIKHSRVARSNIELLSRYGAEIRIAGPRSLLPDHCQDWQQVKVFHNLESALKGADVVMLLRLQLERMGEVFFPSLDEYFNHWGITHEKLALANEDALVFHPGPQNRGVEITGVLVDDEKKVKINQQVSNGLFVRMALLEYCLTGIADD